MLCYLFSDEDDFAECPLREEVADLLEDIRTAVEAGEQILQQGQGRPPVVGKGVANGA
jgi:hypothetical protein